MNGKNVLRVGFVIGTCILMLFLLVYNCELTPPEEPGGEDVNYEYVITVFVDKQVIPADLVSTALVSARVLDPQTNLPIQDVQVRFSVSDGSMDPTIISTNSDGWAYSTLTAGMTPGIATIFVKAGGSRVKTTITYSGDGLTFSIRSTAPVICGEGISSTDIVAHIDVGGNPVEGQSITFTAEAGCLNDNSSGASVTLNTDRNGDASVYLRSQTVDYAQGGISSIVEATWVPSSPFTGNSVIATTTIFMEPVILSCHFEDLTGNIIDSVNRDLGEIAVAVAELTCENEGAGVGGVPILFEIEKGAFIDRDGNRVSSITIYTDGTGRASVELDAGICETQPGSSTMTVKIDSSLDNRFCSIGSVPGGACLLNFTGSMGDLVLPCLDISLSYASQTCNDDSARTFAVFTATVTNRSTGNPVQGADVVFTIGGEGGLSSTLVNCLDSVGGLPPPQCSTKQITVTTGLGGIATAYAYACNAGTSDLVVNASVWVSGVGGSSATTTATGIGTP